jgi:hypothetical protein
MDTIYQRKYMHLIEIIQPYLEFVPYVSLSFTFTAWRELERNL